MGRLKAVTNTLRADILLATNVRYSWSILYLCAGVDLCRPKVHDSGPRVE